MVITTVATDERAPWQGVMAPLLIGLFIFAAADAVGPASGGSFNPARALDPALYNLSFAHIWIYLVAPLGGAVLGGAIRAVFGPAPHARPRRPARLGVLGEPRDGRDKRSTGSAFTPR
jgi:glycerol uptake facilitator-like aquaporin